MSSEHDTRKYSYLSGWTTSGCPSLDHCTRIGRSPNAWHARRADSLTRYVSARNALRKCADSVSRWVTVKAAEGERHNDNLIRERERERTEGKMRGKKGDEWRECCCCLISRNCSLQVPLSSRKSGARRGSCWSGMEFMHMNSKCVCVSRCCRGLEAEEGEKIRS